MPTAIVACGACRTPDSVANTGDSAQNWWVSVCRRNYELLELITGITGHPPEFTGITGHQLLDTHQLTCCNLELDALPAFDGCPVTRLSLPNRRGDFAACVGESQYDGCPHLSIHI
jgi:hypothetical protein